MVPKADRFPRHHFEKVGRRNALAIAVVSMTALVRTGTDSVIDEIHLAWGSVGPTVIRDRSLESSLAGRPLTPKTLEEAAEAVRKIVRPIDDVRAGAEYRRQVAGNLLLRLADATEGQR